MRRKDRRSPERSRGNRGVAELRAEALGTGPRGRDIQDLGYELPRMPIPRTWGNRIETLNARAVGAGGGAVASGLGALA